MLYRFLEAVSSASRTTGFTFSDGNVLPSLKIMGLGMLGIFAVIGVIILVLKVLMKLFPPRESGE